jgi:hypothetical protein
VLAAQGNREYNMQQVVEQLGLGTKMPARKGGPGQPAAAAVAASPGMRFVLPISECEFTINAVLDELQRDAWPTQTAMRPSRCTGTAIQVRSAAASAPWLKSWKRQRVVSWCGVVWCVVLCCVVCLSMSWLLADSVPVACVP